MSTLGPGTSTANSVRTCGESTLVAGLPLREPRVQGNLIAIEGLDGTGKSVLTDLLAAQTGGSAGHTPADVYSPLRTRLHDRHGAEAFLLYLSACAYLAADAANSGNRGLMFADRFWISSVLRHAWMNRAADEEIVDLAKVAMMLLPTPGLTIILTCDQEERMARIQTRGSSNVRDDVGLEYQQYWLNGMSNIHHSLPGLNLVTIDSTRKSPAALCAEILPLLPAGFSGPVPDTGPSLQGCP